MASKTRRMPRKSQVAFAKAWVERQGIEAQTVDVAALIDGSLSYEENIKNLKKHLKIGGRSKKMATRTMTASECDVAIGNYAAGFDHESTREACECGDPDACEDFAAKKRAKPKSKPKPKSNPKPKSKRVKKIPKKTTPKKKKQVWITVFVGREEQKDIYNEYVEDMKLAGITSRVLSDDPRLPGVRVFVIDNKHFPGVSMEKKRETAQMILRACRVARGKIEPKIEPPSISKLPPSKPMDKPIKKVVKPKPKPKLKPKPKSTPKKRATPVKKRTKPKPKPKSAIKGVKLTTKQKKHLKDFGYCNITRNGKQHRITPGRVKKGTIQR